MPVKLGTLGHALLGLLAMRPQSGYELTRAFDVSLANVWSAKHSQIYPELAKLKTHGLVKVGASGVRGSKRYTITPAGRAALVRWLTETDPAPHTLRDESMLRVFFLWMVPPDHAAAYLREQLEQHRTRLRRYRAIREHATAAPKSGNGSESEALRWSLIALEAGIRFENALAGWSAWALREAGAKEQLP